MVKIKKMKRFYLLVSIILILIGGFIVMKKQFTPCAQFRREHPEDASLPLFTSEQLSQYNGVQNQKTYIGYHCVIYDVTEGKDQYYAEGRGYHYLVGRDATKQLEIFGGDIIESKYPKVGLIKE
jgi:predicted heme/steroid binding protein